jgi:hypothetical protein
MTRDECEDNCRALYLPGARMRRCYERCRDTDRLVPLFCVGLGLGFYMGVLVTLWWVT